MRQILRALAYLHERGLVHRDVKPENLLLDFLSPPSCRLADLGFAANSNTKLLNAVLGTVQFMAPEMVRRECYGSGIDIWAAGVICFRLLFGFFPFEGSDSDILRNIKKGIDCYEEKLARLPADAESFLRSLLQIDPRKRLAAQGALHHPFLWRPTELEGSGLSSFRSVAIGVLAMLRLRAIPAPSEANDTAAPPGYSEFSFATRKRTSRKATKRLNSKGYEDLGNFVRSLKLQSDEERLDSDVTDSTAMGNDSNHSLDLTVRGHVRIRSWDSRFGAPRGKRMSSQSTPASRH